MRVLAVLLRKDVFITLDETAHSDTFNLVLVGLASDAVSVPLGFVVYPTDGCWADDARALQQRIKVMFSPEQHITLLADRVPASDAFLSCLDELGWAYVIRLPEDTFIESERDGWKEVRHLRKRRGRLRVFSNVSIWKSSTHRATVCLYPRTSSECHQTWLGGVASCAKTALHAAHSATAGA